MWLAWLWFCPIALAQPFLWIDPVGQPLTLGGEGAAHTGIEKVATLTIETEVSQAWVLDISSTDLTATFATIPVQVAVVPLGDPAPTTFSSNTLSHNGVGSSMWDVYVRHSSPIYLDPGQYQGMLNITVVDE